MSAYIYIYIYSDFLFVYLNFVPKETLQLQNCKTNLQKTNSHEEETVWADSTCKDLIEVPLQKELFQHQDQVRQHRVFLQGGKESFSADIARKTVYSNVYGPRYPPEVVRKLWLVSGFI